MPVIMNWIDVDEQLPTIGDYCLVYQKRKSFNPTNYAITQFTKYGFEVASVTHWATPKPPVTK